MRLQYTPTLEDICHVWRAMPLPLPKRWGIRLVLWGPLLVVGSSITLTFVSGAGWIVVAVVPIGWLILTLRLYRSRCPITTAEWERDPANAEAVVLHVDSDGVLIERKSSSVQFAWFLFDEFKEFNTVFLVRQSHATDHGFLVPKRAFQSVEEMNEFRSLLSASITGRSNSVCGLAENSRAEQVNR